MQTTIRLTIQIKKDTPNIKVSTLYATEGFSVVTIDKNN